MSRDKNKVEKVLLKKGFNKEEGKHHRFYYYTKGGQDTGIYTETSHTKKMKDIPDNLLSLMAKQCKLTKSEFLDLIDCPMSQEKYEKLLNDKKLI